MCEKWDMMKEFLEGKINQIANKEISNENAPSIVYALYCMTFFDNYKNNEIFDENNAKIYNINDYKKDK